MYEEFIAAMAKATQRANDLAGLEDAVALMRRLYVIRPTEANTIRREYQEVVAEFHRSPLYVAWKKQSEGS